MKNIRNKFLALLLITTVAFSSCKKEDHLTPSANTSSTANTSYDNRPIASIADWKITLFQMNESDETKIFSEYAFKFASEGILKAVTDKGSVNGTWSLGKEGKIFNISFPEMPLSMLELKMLNKQWHIANRTATELRLERMNRKGMEYVTFQRFQRQTEIGHLD